MSKTNYYTEKIQKVLPKGIENVFEVLEKDLNVQSEIAKDFLLLKCRYQDIIKDYHLQIITDDTKNVEFNKIRSALLFLTSNLKESDLSNNSFSKVEPSEDYVNQKSELYTLCIDRLKGSPSISHDLQRYAKEKKDDFEIAIIELYFHKYAKFRETKFFKEIGSISYSYLNSDFCKRTAELFNCINLLIHGSESALISAYAEAKKYNKISFQELNFLSFWEGLILISCKEFDKGDHIWKKLTGYSPFIEIEEYPFVNYSREFDRAIFKVLFGPAEIESIVSKLKIHEFKGLAHHSAVNCRLLRRNEKILHNIVKCAEHLNWKMIPEIQIMWDRLKDYEKFVLSNAGTLF